MGNKENPDPDLDDRYHNEPQDEWPATVAEVDQHVAMAPEFCRMMAAEHAGLCEQGVGPFFAAIIVGTRFRMGNN